MLLKFSIQSSIQLIIVIILGSEYGTCYSTVKQTCASKFEIDGRKSNVTFSACAKHCDEDDTCKFIFHVPDIPQVNCLKYSSCDEIRHTGKNGSTYSKEGNCPGIFLFHKWWAE